MSNLFIAGSAVEVTNEMAGILVAMLVIAVIIYVIFAILLNKFNNLVEGKKTVLAWIPFCNTYLLGKLTFSKMFGWILLACSIITSLLASLSTSQFAKNVISEQLASTLSSIYSVGFLVVVIMAFVKYNSIKKQK